MNRREFFAAAEVPMANHSNPAHEWCARGASTDGRKWVSAGRDPNVNWRYFHNGEWHKLKPGETKVLS